MADIPAIITALIHSGYPKPTPQTIQSFFSSRATPPLPAQIATAKKRLSVLNLRTPGLFDASAQSHLPASVPDPSNKEMVIRGPALLQVLEVEDIGKSRWGHIEAIEAMERCEKTKGKEIIRDIPSEDGENAEGGGGGGSVPQNNRKGGPHKLLLEDWKGRRIYGMELSEVPKIEVNMAIGCKIVVRNLVVARGMALLEPGNTEVLGGEVKELNETWKRDRKKILSDGIPRAVAS